MTSSSQPSTAFTLRPYQREAVTATIQHFRQTSEGAVIVLPTGAGKSLVIAELGKLANRRVLVLAHVKELVVQNHQKYESYGFNASIFAAGLNRKEAVEKVTFGSVQSVARNLEEFEREYSLLVIDECHRVSLDENSEYQKIIRHLKAHNASLKVLGLTATPYRLDSGWVYQRHLPRKLVRTDDETPFKSCIFELPLQYMIKSGFLTPPRLLDAPIALYDFEQLRTDHHRTHYREEDLDRILQGAKRATARIVDQVIDLAEDRSGVMIFAATVKHAKEVLSYLPPESSAIIIGDMRPKARDSVIQAFKQKQIKYLVNVSVLTTGFDAPHVDLIAMLRPTESAGLYQQIIGRGLRLSPGKTDCLILDYAGNTHDLYQPDITAPKPDSDSVIVEVSCPLCQYSNQFWGKTDNDGDIIEHYGRRCQGLIPQDDSDSDHQLQQCDFRFRFKECGQCGAENDIAARQCHQCDHLLVDPDQKLKDALKLRDAKVIRCAGMSLHQHLNKDKEPRLKVVYHDEEGVELSEIYALSNQAQQGRFYHQFVRQHLKLPEERFFPKHPEDVIREQHRFRSPDFVIARKNGRFWTIRDRIFDYEGRYRRANELF
ncbi:DEAD/DEAH box helicase [Pseudomaricurvus sp.]|uniref:DEAD/DEAH box helicase n=1 Tax=Pseudomaricurvus sp. TaxID=2004510 RepID=UPI003F6D6CA8